MDCKSGWIKQSSNFNILLEELNSRKSVEKPAVAVAWQYRRKAHLTHSLRSRKANALRRDENQGYKFYKELVSHKSYILFSFSRAALLRCPSKVLLEL